MNGIVCISATYLFEGWHFEFSTFGGPWPLKKDGDLRKLAGRKFWAMWSRFSVLSDKEKQKHLVTRGGCFPIGD